MAPSRPKTPQLTQNGSQNHPKSTQNGSQNGRCSSYFLIVCLLILCLILFLGQADQIREEHTQSTHRAHTEQLSPRFPFLCQDRFPRYLKRGFKNEVEKHVFAVEQLYGPLLAILALRVEEKHVEKVIPKGPQMDTKS